MKRLHSTALRLSILSLLMGSLGMAAAQNPKEVIDNRRTLSVTGSGEVTAAPDHAIVRLGATAQAEDAAAAQTSVNEVMQKALSQIEKAGIPRKLIRTSGLTLAPVYASKTEGSREPKVVAYRAGNIIEATVDDTKRVGQVIDAGLNAGANRLEGVTFGLKNDLPARTVALEKAVEEARNKARTMARALDVPLGAVREVVEGGVQILRPERFAASRAMFAGDAMQTPVEPGEVRIQASVTIHYDIAPGK